MKKAVLMVVLLSLSLFAKSNMQLAKAYMEISGTNETIERLSENIIYGIKQRSSIFGSKKDEKLIKLFSDAFDADSSKALVLHYIASHLKKERLEKVIKFYKSETGRKYVEANLAANTPEAKAEALRYFAALQSNPPSKERISLTKALVDTMKLGVVVKDVFAETLYFLNYQAPKNKRVDEDKLENYLEMMSKELKAQVYLSALFTYRDLSNVELKEIIAFYKSYVGKRERDVAIDATKRMVRQGFIRALKSNQLIK